MNKELLNQIPADEQPVAAELYSASDEMKISPAFQRKLEMQLMDGYKANVQPARGRWHTKLRTSVVWALLALCGLFLLNWGIRSRVSDQPAMETVSDPEIPFEHQVRDGRICAGALAVAHNFSISLTNPGKTGFIMLNEQKTIGELRALAWSPDGKQLALVGNTTGRGNIYIMDSANGTLRPVLSNPGLGYLMDVDWSHDGKQLLTWSLQNNSIVYVLKADGTSLIERQLDMQIFATPQFAPDNQSIIFYGADSSSSTSLFQVMMDGSKTIRIISDLVEDESSFAWSPDGSRLAYIEMDRSLGEAHLLVEATNGSDKVVLATLPIPRGSGSSIPESANLSWSPDGKSLVFEFGRTMTDRAIYLTYADGTGYIKLADEAHAPAISPDGNCLAYISNKQVFLLDLTKVSLTSADATRLLVAELPAGQQSSDFRLDKLQWSQETKFIPGQP